MRFPPHLLLLCGVVFSVFLACHSRPATVTTSSPAEVDAPDPQERQKQEMAALAFLAYTGDDLEGSDDKVEQQLGPCLTTALADQPLTRAWTLAWGPAVYKFPIAKLDDNMMYVVRGAEPSQLAIAVRGTNPRAILDWLVEDFWVREQVPWGYGDPPSGAKISKAISEGLKILQKISPPTGGTLIEFLKAESQTNAPLQIAVTGHSLGGALAPTLALWLDETRGDWNGHDAKISVYPLAGPTAGNAEFAAHSDRRIGAYVYRLHNPYDVVALTWNHQSMGKLVDLYRPLTRPNVVERGVIDGLRELIKHRSYSQVNPDAPPLPGALHQAKRSYAAQAGWQHHCGYTKALGIAVAVTADCRSHPVDPCVEPPPPTP